MRGWRGLSIDAREQSFANFKSISESLLESLFGTVVLSGLSSNRKYTEFQSSLTCVILLHSGRQPQ